MSADPDPIFAITPDDIRRSGWEAELAGADQPEQLRYYGLLFAKAEKLRAAGDEAMAQVFALFGTVATLAANYTKRQPYEWELTRADGPRINQADITTLRAVLNEIRDPEFRAKVADVIWEMGRNARGFELARTAVEAFLASAERLETGDRWLPFAERIERALQLATKVHRGKELQQKVVAIIEEKIAKYAPDVSSGLLCLRLTELLLACQCGDPSHYAALADANEAAGKFHFAHNYWMRSAQWHGKAKDELGAREAIRRGGEAHVLLAEANLSSKNPNAGFAAHWIGVAREELQRAGAPASRLQELHHRMLELQAEFAKTMQSIELPDSLIDSANEAVALAEPQARAFVSGLDLPHALFRLAVQFPVTDSAALRREVEEMAREYVFAGLVGQSVISSDGRTLGSSPPLTTGSEDIQEAAIEKNMCLRAKEWRWWFHIAGCVDPAREQIIEEYRPTFADLAFVVRCNPVVPPGREKVFVRGLFAGFEGDWLTALHILIPQFEHSLRFVLTQSGVITSTVKADGTQPELSLDWLLTRPKTKELVGADMVFDLRGLLTSKFGCNFRNDLAHGLAEPQSFEPPFAEYVWWLIIRWLFLPALRLAKGKSENV